MKGQLELYASHGVYVTVTGAAVSNAMFLVPFSSVIEIFPPLVDQNLGPTVAVINGMGYYPVHTHNATAYYKEIQVKLCHCLCVLLRVRVGCDRCVGVLCVAGDRDGLLCERNGSGDGFRFEGVHCASVPVACV